MKKETIVVLKGSEGEYDSYREWIDSVYRVRQKNFDAEKEWEKYTAKLLNDNGFKTRINESGYCEMVWEKGEAKLRRLELLKLRRMLKNEFTFQYFLEVIIKAEKLEFIEQYI